MISYSPAWSSPWQTNNSQQSATWARPSPAAGGASSSSSGGISGSTVLAAGGAAIQALGAYYSAKAAKSQLRSQALSLDFQAYVANQNARAAEREARDVFRAAAAETGRITLAAGQQISQEQTGQAARGIQAGVGSAAETLASSRLVLEMDKLAIRSNAVRAANAARTQGQNFRNESLLARTSARNARITAGSIKPLMVAAGSLLGGAGQVAGSYYAGR